MATKTAGKSTTTLMIRKIRRQINHWWRNEGHHDLKCIFKPIAGILHITIASAGSGKRYTGTSEERIFRDLNSIQRREIKEFIDSLRRKFELLLEAIEEGARRIVCRLSFKANAFA